MPNTQVTNRNVKDAAITGVKLNVLTTKGDLMVYDTVADREAVGADGTVLIADSSQTTGVRWGTNAAVAFQSLSSDPGSPTNSSVWYNTTNFTFKASSAFGTGTFPLTIFVNPSTSSAVTGTTTETLFNQFVSIPANSLTVGSTIHLQAFGQYTDAIANTLRFRMKLGTTVVIDSGVLTSVTGSNKQWNMEGYLTITASGASGTLNGAGFVGINDGNFTALAIAGASCDTTASNNLGVSVQWGTANADTINMGFIIIQVVK